jgi:hypothetical protein
MFFAGKLRRTKIRTINNSHESITPKQRKQLSTLGKEITSIEFDGNNLSWKMKCSGRRKI